MTNDATTAVRILELPVPGNDTAGTVTGREWLAGLLRATWLSRDLFGLPGCYWPGGLYQPLTAAGLVTGSYDVDGGAHEVDFDAADELILAAIDAMGQVFPAAGPAAGPAHGWAGELADAGLRSITGDLNAGRPVTWSSAVAPGGTVCAVPDPACPDGICGNPVESEPCGQHDSELPGYLGMLEAAWGLIANAGWNAGTGDVTGAKSPGWHEAAMRWRDNYHAWLSFPPRDGLTPPEVVAGEIEALASDTRGVVILGLGTAQRAGIILFRANAYRKAAGQVRERLAPAWDALTAERDGLRGQLAATDAIAGQWPRCPDGCGCRLGTEDAEAGECGCDGPCTTECRENGYPDAPSYRDQAVKHAMDERDEALAASEGRRTSLAEATARLVTANAELATCRERNAVIAVQSDRYRDERDEAIAGFIDTADRDEYQLVIREMLDWYWQPGGVNAERVADWRKRAGLEPQS
jgi:hypothetical protein